MLTSQRLLFAAAVAVPLGLLGLAGWLNFRQVQSDAQDRAAHGAHALSEHAHRTFRAHELILEFVDRYTEGLAWQDLRDTPALHRMLSRLVGTAPDVASVFMADASGRNDISSRRFPMPAIDVSDREYYRALLKEDVLHISEPASSRMSAERFFTIARRRTSADGRFDGLIAVSVNPGYFEGFFAGIVHATEAASLVRSDGTLLARHPSRPEPAAPLPPTSGFMRAIAAEPTSGVYVTRSLTDGIERMIAYRRVGTYPVYASFQLSMGEIWGDWHRAMVPYALATLLAMALLLAGVSLAGQRARRAAAEARSREAEQASRAKDLFVAALSHELRNPLAAIAAAAELLQRSGAADAQTRTATAIISRQIGLLRRMLDDLLDTARALHGKLHLEKRRVDLRVLAEEALAELAPPSVKQRIEARGGAPWVEADPVRLKQMLGNLIENAVKYGARHIDIAIDAGPQWVEAAVRDDGEGIAPGLLPKLFSPFVQGAQNLDRPRGGLGLGLSLVQRLAAQHGGTLTAASEGPGRGSTFTLRLPRAEAPARAVSSARVGAGLAAARILIVDDEPDARESLRMLLEQLGHEVGVAADGTEGLRRLERFRPRFALVDIGLPGIDGYELARRARKLDPRLVLVAVTGYGQPQDRERAAAAGFDAHLVKPFSYEDLARTLARFAPGRDLEDAA